MLLRLKKNWPANFRRTPRDAKGQPLGPAVEFSPGVPVEVRDEWRDSFAPDIGPALEVVPMPVAAREPAPVDEVPDPPPVDEPPRHRSRRRESTPTTA